MTPTFDPPDPGAGVPDDQARPPYKTVKIPQPGLRPIVYLNVKLLNSTLTTGS